jgi:hypothetical protein
MEQGIQQGWGYSGSSVYVGLAGIALMYFRLHEACLASGEGSGSRDKESKNMAQAYLEKAFTLISVTRPSSVSSIL